MQPATVFPWLTYDDAHAAIDFLQTAFGGEVDRIETSEDGSVPHAELRFGNGVVIVGSSGPNLPASAGTAGRGSGIYIVVDDVDAHHVRAREYAARDPEGNVWRFGTYQPLEGH